MGSIFGLGDNNLCGKKWSLALFQVQKWSVTYWKWVCTGYDIQKSQVAQLVAIIHVKYIWNSFNSSKKQKRSLLTFSQVLLAAIVTCSERHSTVMQTKTWLFDVQALTKTFTFAFCLHVQSELSNQQWCTVQKVCSLLTGILGKAPWTNSYLQPNSGFIPPSFYGAKNKAIVFIYDGFNTI